jgi:hypothetical protein
VLFARNLGDFVPDVHLTLVDVLDRFEVDVLLDVTDDVLVGVALLHSLLMKMDYYRREVDVALQRKDWRLVVSAFLQKAYLKKQQVFLPLGLQPRD